jgi:hypothetical protein
MGVGEGVGVDDGVGVSVGVRVGIGEGVGVGGANGIVVQAVRRRMSIAQRIFMRALYLCAGGNFNYQDTKS